MLTIFIRLLTAIAVTFSCLSPAVAQSRDNGIFSPPGSTRPATTSGGGTRNAGNCTQDPIGGFQNIVSLVGEKTSEPKPTFRWQVPSTSAKSAEFSIVTQEGKEVYRTTLPLTSEARELSIPLPEALQNGQRYRWALALVCQPNDRLHDHVVSGSIEYIPQNSLQF